MEYYFIDRKTKIKKFDDLSILTKSSNSFSVSFPKEEIYCFQLALLSDKKTQITNVKINGNQKAFFTCINSEGTDTKGNYFTKIVNVNKDEIRPMFFMFDYTKSNINKDTVKIIIETKNSVDELEVDINLTDEKVENFGFNELDKMSRLVWLNSKKAIDNSIVKPYTPIKNQDNIFEILGRRITFGKNALPKKIESYFDEGVNLCDTIQANLLKSGMEFLFAEEEFSISNIENNKNYANITAICKKDNVEIKVKSTLKYDGSIKTDIFVKANDDVKFDNVSYSFCLCDYACRYMNGFSQKGGKYQDTTERFEIGKYHDCMFLGNINTGIKVKFKAENYVKPLCNIYYHYREIKIPTTTWDNDGQGRFNIKGNKVSFDTNSYCLKKGEERTFSLEFYITPFKAVNYKEQYNTRYFQRHDFAFSSVEADISEAKEKGYNWITYHHDTSVNPYLNYPFVEARALKDAVDKAKKEGINTKIYYTSRESSNHMEEVFAYKALESEIIIADSPKLNNCDDNITWNEGNVSDWILEYFGKTVLPGWKVHFNPEVYKSDDDATMIVNPQSRLNNYYIEGLDWLIENVGIKGIYVDDTELDATALERARKIIDKVNGKIDMHTWNHHHKWAGDISSLNSYTEILPYIDSMWIGEGFDVNEFEPDFIMTEISALPYGLSNMMLDGGDNIYIGLLYCMNSRYGWTDYTTEEYKLWDDFGVVDSEFLGYWHSKNPICVKDSDVLCSCYKKKDKLLICLNNFSESDKQIKLYVNNLEFNYDNILEIPEINGYQEKGTHNLDDTINLSKKSGLVLILNKKG